MNLKTTFLTLIFTLLNFFTWGQCIGFGTQSTTSPNKDDMHFVYACNSSNILLSDGLTVVGGTAPYSYLWQNITNETITNSTSFNATLSGVPTTGYLHLRVTDANGCISWDSVFVESNCCNNFGTQSTTSPNKDDMHFVYACNSSNILLSDGLTVVGGTAPYSYLWQNITNETLTNSTSFNATLSGVPTSGYLHLRVTDANGCISWDSVFVEQDPNCISTGMQQILPSKQLKIVQVYPNPTEENTTLTLSLIESMEITVTAHTLSGQLVSKHKHTLTSGTSTIQLATKELPQGIYLIAVSNNEEITTNFKLIKK